MHSKPENQKIYLAPMEDVSDYPFRQILLKIGRPDVFFTEFVNVDGLVSQGRKHVAHRLEKEEREFPVVVQFWGNDPKKFVKAANMVKGMGFAGIDVNLGCPVKKVLKVGCGSALINNYEVVENIVKSLQDCPVDLPVSVKTRLGFERIDLDSWIGFLLKLNLDTLFLHGRVARQLFSGEANWSAIGEVVKMRDSFSPQTKVVGNGDVCSIEQSKTLFEVHNVDGVMIGREVLKNPWVFGDYSPTCKERIATLLLHLNEMKIFTKEFPDKGWSSIKKFYYGYLREDEELTSFRKKLFEINNIDESIEFLKTQS